MRPALLLTLLSLPAAAQSAAQVCGKILYSDQKVACVRAIAGHDVEPEAAQVCGTILYADQIVRCMSGILDKHYESDELSACRSILYADQKADCMSAAGQSKKVTRQRERDRARERDRDDDDVAEDEDEEPRRARFDSTVTFDNRTSRATVNRYYWRLPGRGRWTEFGGRRRLPAQELISLESASGLYDFCVQTTDGRSAYWGRIRLDASENRLWFKADQLEALDCRDR